MSFGDYLQLQRENQRKIADVDIVVGTQNYGNVLSPRNATSQLFIQRIMLSITTHFDGTMTFDDDGAGPPIAVFTDEATVVPTVPSSWVWDFGPYGRPLTVGANLDIGQSAAGIVAVVHIEGYERSTTPVTPAQA